LTLRLDAKVKYEMVLFEATRLDPKFKKIIEFEHSANKKINGKYVPGLSTDQLEELLGIVHKAFKQGPNKAEKPKSITERYNQQNSIKCELILIIPLLSTPSSDIFLASYSSSSNESIKMKRKVRSVNRRKDKNLKVPSGFKKVKSSARKNK